MFWYCKVGSGLAGMVWCVEEGPVKVRYGEAGKSCCVGLSRVNVC